MGRGGDVAPGKRWTIVAPLRHGKEQMCSPYPAEVLAQARQNKDLGAKMPPAKVRIKTPAKLNIALPQIGDENQGYKAQPDDKSALLPQVQWRDAGEFIKDPVDGSKLPLCTWLGI